MAVISFSTDEHIKADVERMAAETGRSQSAIFREMYDAYKFKKTLAKVQRIGREKFLALGIESIDQAEAYLG